MRPFLAVSVLVLSLLSAGCGGSSPSGGDTGDPAETGGGGSGGSGSVQPDAPDFTTVYEQVLHMHGCVGSYCHFWGNGAGTSEMDTVYKGLVGVPAKDDACKGHTLVVPGDPEHSLMYLKMTMTQPPCGKQMPYEGQPVPADQAELVRAWIAAGAHE